MPVYEYECKKCRHRFELKRSFGEDGSANCPICGARTVRIFTSVPVIFKGSGFYITDHRKKEDSAPTPTETKAETKEPAVSPKKD